MYGYDHGLWMMGGWLIMLLIWIIPLVILFLAIRQQLNRRGPTAPKSAFDLLEEAYARGDIDREVFLQKRDDLQRK